MDQPDHVTLVTVITVYNVIQKLITNSVLCN